MESICNAILYGINGIIIQQLDKQQVEATGDNSTIKSTGRRRLFKPIYRELQQYQWKRQEKPSANQTIGTTINQLDMMLSKQEDLLWLLLRYRNKDNQLYLGGFLLCRSFESKQNGFGFASCNIRKSNGNFLMKST